MGTQMQNTFCMLQQQIFLSHDRYVLALVGTQYAMNHCSYGFACGTKLKL